MEFHHRTNTQTSVGVTQALTPSAAFSFQILFALQREFRRLHSADGSKLFRLYTSPSARDSSRHVWRSELSAGDRVSAQFLTRVPVSISIYENCSVSYREISCTNVAKVHAAMTSCRNCTGIVQVLQQKRAYLHFESYIQLRGLHLSILHLLLLRDTFAIILL